MQRSSYCSFNFEAMGPVFIFCMPECFSCKGKIVTIVMQNYMDFKSHVEAKIFIQKEEIHFEIMDN